MSEEPDKMRMLMDVGNTNITLGIWNGGKITVQWRIDSDKIGTEDVFFSTISPLLINSGIKQESIESMAIASVIPGKQFVFRRFAEKYFNTKPIFVKAADGFDITWKADNPKEIGADRIANVLGAKDYYGSNAIVLDFGTAINVDVLFRDAFVGGSILLGINTSMKALFSNAAMIPPVELFMEDHYLGTNTGDNIRIGLVNAKYFALKGITEQIMKELGEEVPVIATGGLSGLFQFDGTFIDYFDPDLTLKGIASFQDRFHEEGRG